ncbi:hypothetical protein [Streptomyces sp. NBC_01244]|uniref:hypothetical protein n=1 Tax=Streptomyces sp. NBC_01244 TaxID=2903797 RepID=UPI002E108E6E|nr:hypothetical protein OG247_44295 [Streptomyces sp. NBC_01244]
MLIALISGRKSMKTTAASLICHALAARTAPQSYEPIGYDADSANHFKMWADEAEDNEALEEYPFPVHSVAHNRFQKAVVREYPHEGKVGVVDTGHMEDHVPIAKSVLMASDVAILVLEPTFNETERLVKQLSLSTIMRDVDKQRANEGKRPLRRLIMLSKYYSATRDWEEVRDDILDQQVEKDEHGDPGAWLGWEILSTKIPYRADLSRVDAFNPPSPALARKMGFDELITELEQKGILQHDV